MKRLLLRLETIEFLFAGILVSSLALIIIAGLIAMFSDVLTCIILATEQNRSNRSGVGMVSFMV